MKPENFVQAIQESIIDSTISSYQEIFSSTDIEGIGPGYWKDALKLFRKLDDKDQEIFFRIVRFVQVEAVAGLLAVLDGVSSLEGQKEDFLLLEEGGEEPINGDLATIFLNMEDPDGHKYA